MSRILAIDPGNEESGWVIIDAETCEPLEFDKSPNIDLARWMRFGDMLDDIDIVAIEMVASYGMAVGAEVFDTCVWIGRFVESAWSYGDDCRLVKRQPVKVHHCHSSKANDSNVRQALVDRFAPGQPNHGKGTKADPGWFHGFRADIWQAYALAVYSADQMEGSP